MAATLVIVKLRFKGNTLRFRLNQSEVRGVAAGMALEGHILFPGAAKLSYVLRAGASDTAARFESGVITVSAPQEEVQSWAASDEVGLYLEFPAAQDILKVSIEKDLECVDAPATERDPDAFPRADAGSSC